MVYTGVRVSWVFWCTTVCQHHVISVGMMFVAFSFTYMHYCDTSSNPHQLLQRKVFLVHPLLLQYQVSHIWHYIDYFPTVNIFFVYCCLLSLASFIIWYKLCTGIPPTR